MIKKLVEVLVMIFFLGLACTVSRKKFIHSLLFLLPFSFNGTFNAVNPYVILASGSLFALRFWGDIKTTLPDKRVLTLMMMIFVSHVMALLLNIDDIKYDGDYIQYYNFLWLASDFALFIIIVSGLKSADDARNAVNIIIIAYLISSVASIVELVDPGNLYIVKYFSHMSKESFENRGMRVSGTFSGEYELYSEYSAIMVIFLIYLTMSSRHLIDKAFYSLCCAYSFFMVIMTKTRGGLIALGAAVMYLITIHLSRRLKTIPIGFMCVLAGLIGMSYIVSTKFTNYDLFSQSIKVTSNIRNGKLDTRAELWGLSGTIASNYPYVFFGTGSPHLSSISKRYHTFPHNLILALLLWVGYFGLFWYLVFIVYVYRSPRHVVMNDVGLLRIFAKTFIVLFMVDELVIEFIRQASNQNVIWSLFGLAYLVNRHLLTVPCQPGAAVE